VIRSFQFVPLGTPARPWFSDMHVLSNGYFQTRIHGEFDRRYEIQTSTNLATWQRWATLLATNSSVDFSDRGATENARQWYRALAVP